MIPLKIPTSHPNAPVIQKWAKDKETILDSHARQILQLQTLLKTILKNSPSLGQ